MLSISEVLAKADEQPEWICNPYVARRGITFLHGKTSIGKSPVTWEIARAASQGLSCFGWPTVPSRVLYLDADTAELILRPRLRLLTQPIGDWRIAFLSGRTINICNRNDGFYDLAREWRKTWEPDLVIWNTLRQFYRGSAIDSDTVTQVYNGMYSAFPHAGHLVVAHDRKTSTDPDAPETDDEAFSGSAAWRDLATIGLHLVRRGDKKGTYLSLEHTKTQVSEQVQPLRLRLDENGTTLTSALPPRERILELWAEAKSQGAKDCATWVSDKLSVHRATIFRIKGKGFE